MFIARTEELVQKTMCEHLCDPTSEEEEVAMQKPAQNVPDIQGRLRCSDFLLLGRDHERILNFKLSHYPMTEDLYLILISKISLDRDQH